MGKCIRLPSASRPACGGPAWSAVAGTPCRPRPQTPGTNRFSTIGRLAPELGRRARRVARSGDSADSRVKFDLHQRVSSAEMCVVRTPTAHRGVGNALAPRSDRPWRSRSGGRTGPCRHPPRPTAQPKRWADAPAPAQRRPCRANSSLRSRAPRRSPACGKQMCVPRSGTAAQSRDIIRLGTSRLLQCRKPRDSYRDRCPRRRSDSAHDLLLLGRCSHGGSKRAHVRRFRRPGDVCGSCIVWFTPPCPFHVRPETA